MSRYMYAGEDLLAFGDASFIAATYEFLAQQHAYRVSPFGGESADVMPGLFSFHLGDAEAAERHYLEGLEWARRPNVRFGLVEGRCLQGLADVAEARGEHSKAMEYLDGAAAKFAEYGAKLYLDQVLAKKSLLGA